MNEMIKLYDLFGTEIRSHSNADVLREKILDCNISIIDLSQITFISRSFADELCNLSESENIKIYNAKGIVKNMLSIVSESRKNKRIRNLAISKAFLIFWLLYHKHAISVFL